ncbi:general stress protein [Neobacillus mesonae]|uniref:general stress protein n=1 Tax=Neobacillus mesonae TaxID=1193713 RepID=UPI00203FBEA4|nr:general stress protein [Neobacillus mesonae]MCM3570513.1 general stress protein [Neobacillus mesonae]
MNTVKVVENGAAAKNVIDQYNMQGFTKDDIYLLAHDKTRSEDLTDALDIQDIGVKEEGFFESIANVFRTRGDELRSKLVSLGLSHAEAERCEEEMDRGRVVVIASTQP